MSSAFLIALLPTGRRKQFWKRGVRILKPAASAFLFPPGLSCSPRKKGQAALTALVLKYLGETSGKIADLFCGVGTFSYPLAQKPGNRVLAVDASKELLEGFKNSVNRQMIANIEIVCRNLFKYPLEGAELEGLAAVVFDPPRAGAKEQAARLAALPAGKRPRKLIARFLQSGNFCPRCGNSAKRRLSPVRSDTGRSVRLYFPLRTGGAVCRRRFAVNNFLPPIYKLKAFLYSLCYVNRTTRNVLMSKKMHFGRGRFGAGLPARRKRGAVFPLLSERAAGARVQPHDANGRQTGRGQKSN